MKVAEGALGESVGKLSVANKAIEDLRKQLPGGGLLKDPLVLMAVSEHITVLEGLLPPVMAERSSMFSQRQAQAIRSDFQSEREVEVTWLKLTFTRKARGVCWIMLSLLSGCVI